MIERSLSQEHPRAEAHVNFFNAKLAETFPSSREQAGAREIFGEITSFQEADLHLVFTDLSGLSLTQTN